MAISWIVTFGKAGIDYARGIASDSQGNVYVVGSTTDSSAQALIAKYDVYGDLLWVRSIGVATGTDLFMSVTVGQDGTVYAAGSTAGTGTTAVLVVAYSPLGAHIWTRNIAHSPSAVMSCRQIYVQDNALYLAAFGNGHTILKLDFSGNILWQRKIITGATDEGAEDVAITSDYVYLTGNAGKPTAGTETQVGTFMRFAKTGAVSGNDIYRRLLGPSPNSIGMNGMFEHLGFMYATINDSNTAVESAVIKFDETGTIAWQKRFTGNGNMVLNSLRYDGNGYFYAVGRLLTSGYVAKISLDGEIAWQKTITVSAGTVNIFRCHVDVINSSIIVSTQVPVTGTNGTMDAALIKLQANGSDVGAYGNYTISDVPAVPSNSNYRFETISVTNSTNFVTTPTYSHVQATPTITSTRILMSEGKPLTYRGFIQGG